jgi:AmiR/NasT family two-component response regulator
LRGRNEGDPWNVNAWYNLSKGSYSIDKESRFAAKQHQAMSNATSSLTGKRAVIVEDEEVLHLQLRKALHAAGLRVVGGALNAQDGIDVVLSKRPDIVLMDIHMPGPFDGLDAAEVILSRYSTCIVMLTGYRDEAQRRRAETLRLSGYLVKPITPEALIAELRQAFSEWADRGTRDGE